MFAARTTNLSHRVGYSCAWGFLVMAAIGSPLQAQNYKTIPPKLDVKEANQLKVKVAAALRNPAGFGTDQTAVADYLMKFQFPMMTKYGPDELARLAADRVRHFKLIAAAANAGSQQFLVDITLKAARVLARDNYHPAVRYNAVLMLGDLDKQLATSTTPAVPLPAATKELLELASQGKINGVVIPESVKLGALIGLERHSRLGMDPALTEQSKKTMLGVIADREAGEGVEQDVHDWVRTLASQVLANLSAQGPTKEIQDTFTKMIADKKMGLDDRCNVTAALGKMKYTPSAEIDGQGATMSLAGVTSDVVAEAAKVAEKYQKEALGGADFSRPGGFGGGGYGGGRGEFGGGGFGNQQEMGPKFDRRQLMARLMNITTGGKSLSAGLPDDFKSRLEELLTEIKPVRDTMEAKGSVDLDVTKEVIALEGRLKMLLEGWPKPAGAEKAAPEKAEDFEARQPERDATAR